MEDAIRKPWVSAISVLIFLIAIENFIRLLLIEWHVCRWENGDVPALRKGYAVIEGNT
jgi:hypothetical protein